MSDAMKICFWDDVSKTQREREATPAERAQRAADMAAAAIVLVPQTVTRRQARQALLLRGYLDRIPATIAAIPDTTARRMAEIEWEDAREFDRQRPLVISMGAALGINLDELFILAGTL